MKLNQNMKMLKNIFKNENDKTQKRLNNNEEYEK